jgi:hypothetical protein
MASLNLVAPLEDARQQTTNVLLHVVHFPTDGPTDSGLASVALKMVHCYDSLDQPFRDRPTSGTVLQETIHFIKGDKPAPIFVNGVANRRVI